MQRLISVVPCFFLLASPAMGQWQYSFRLDDESRIIVENDGNPLHIVGIEFYSQEGLLNLGSAVPFGKAFGPTSNHIPLANPDGGIVAFDRAIVFDVKYTGDPAHDDLEVVVHLPDAPGAQQGPVIATFRPSVPEPPCWLMAIVGLLGFTLLRSSRRACR